MKKTEERKRDRDERQVLEATDVGQLRKYVSGPWRIKIAKTRSREAWYLI